MMYVVHRTDQGTAAARPVVGWMDLWPEAAAAQSMLAGHALLPAPAFDPGPDLDSASQRRRHTVDEATGVVTATAGARFPAAMETALLALRKRRLIGQQMDALRWDRVLSDATLSAAVARIGAIGALASLDDPDPAPIVEADDPDAMRFLDRVFRRGNVLGAVTRTLGGRVTGALIEEGANANGKYVRLAGGLAGSVQVAWHTMTSDAAADVTWTYPAAFANDETVVFGVPLAPGAGLSQQFFYPRSPGPTSVAFSILANATTRLARAVDLLAVGRWPQA